jgi:hypothetical protein
MMLLTLIRHGTLYVMWSCASTRVPFIELTRAEQLSELDFGCWRIHIKIDWRPKGWDEAEVANTPRTVVGLNRAAVGAVSVLSGVTRQIDALRKKIRCALAF